MSDAQAIYDLPEDQYHAETGLGPDKWLTRSMIHDYMDSKRGFYLRHVAKVRHAQKSWSTSMQLGSVVDAILSGGELVEIPAEHLTPSGSLSTKKTTREWVETQTGTLTAPAVLDLAKLLAYEARRHPVCNRLIEKTTAHQVTLRWTDPRTGLRLQTRPDRLADGLCWADDKTTAKRLDLFMTAVSDYGYDIQQVMCMDGAAACGFDAMPFCFLVMQTKYPFDCAIMRLEQRVVESAYTRFHKALDGIAAKDFGSTDSDLRQAPVPFWWTARYETEEGDGVAV